MSGIKQMVEYLSSYDGSPIKIMEVCGTHTAAIFKSGIRSFLSDKIRLISGPGCPVCVTPTSFIDRCNEYATKPNHIVISFGDMLKVPGEEMSLAQIKGKGGSVSMVYSPFDVIKAAEKNPSVTYIIAAVGFETTTPVFALLMNELTEKGLENVKLLTSLKSALPAIEWVCVNEKDIDGFLCPGHVAVITGIDSFTELAERYEKPFVIAGFEEQHVLKGIYETVRSIERTRSGAASGVRNLYAEAVRPEGNIKAMDMIAKYFDCETATWRGLGEIPGSGYYIKKEFEILDAGSRGLVHDKALPRNCRCADVITGRIDPEECPMFGEGCSPVTPYGPCMVSAEGSCGIWYQNR